MLVDSSVGVQLDPQIGRHFVAEKSDQRAVAAWENRLSQWGQKKLDRLTPEEKAIEIARREAGASAAREATNKTVAAGGELTIGPIVEPGSPSSAFLNMLVLGLAPSTFLDIILSILEAASAGEHRFKDEVTMIRSMNMDFGLTMTANFKMIFEEEFSGCLFTFQGDVFCL